ncbi:MAG: restriction endonuclease subunit S [Gracilimonas sp.]
MGLRVSKISQDQLSEDPYLRNDVKFHSFIDAKGWNLFDAEEGASIKLKYILNNDYNNFNFEDDTEYKGVPTGNEYIDQDGKIIASQIITKDNHPNRLKYLVSNDNILISSVRLAKTPALHFPNENLSDHVFSNGYYIFNVNSEWNIKFILYVLRLEKIKSVLDNHIYRGIGISSYKQEDLLRIEIPIVPKEEQDKAYKSIIKIEKKINNLKSRLIGHQDIMTDVLFSHFDIEKKSVKEVDESNKLNVGSDLAYRNQNIRISFRWNKIAPIQDILYKNTNCVRRLGEFITDTRNGWSPRCRESDDSYMVFGVSSINKSGVISYDDIKYTDKERKNLDTFFAEKGDLFISRGNTVELVALASIVKELPEDKDVIFPDLFIRVGIDTTRLNKEYLVYLINSDIGRYYFKYSSKGKNQSMVKISQDELNDFFLPIPTIDEQDSIVNTINTELDKRKEIEKKINSYRDQINTIIESTLLG